MELKVEWTRDNFNEGFSSYSGTDGAGNKYRMSADLSRVKVTLVDGRTGKGSTAQEAYVAAKKQRQLQPVIA
jgi:hypothetical protein